MSTTADESAQAISAELSEADRAAWLRIERALRGMRWWMLFLAMVATLIGLFLGVGFAIAVSSELAVVVGRASLLIVSLSSTSITGIALFPVAFALARGYATVRRLGNRVNISMVERVLTRQRTAWITMAFCSVVSMCCAALWFVGIFLLRFVWTSAMLEDANPATNPFAFGQHDVAELPLGDSPLELSSTIASLNPVPSWMAVCAACTAGSLSLMIATFALMGFAEWRSGIQDNTTWNVMAGIVLLLVSYCWPGYWLFKTTSRIHHAVEEQTLSSIADVLEAQRSFWQSLGILALLAIATIVALAIAFP